MVISPKYKKDVEGGGDDEHSQHTKYIHSQVSTLLTGIQRWLEKTKTGLE